MTLIKFLLILSALFGTFFIISNGQLTSFGLTNIWGDLLAIFGALCWGLFSDLGKRVFVSVLIHLVRNLLWTDVSLLNQQTSEGTFYFPDMAWVVSRQRIDGEFVAFAAKGGYNLEPHNHNDLGHFIVRAGGETLLADLGRGEYTHQYFTEGRDIARKYFTSMNNAHNGEAILVYRVRLRGTDLPELAIIDFEFHCDLLA